MSIYPFLKELYPTDSVKYFRVKSDCILYWKSHINTIAAKLNAAYAMLYKVRSLRDFVNENILKSIYHTSAASRCFLGIPFS